MYVCESHVSVNYGPYQKNIMSFYILIIIAPITVTVAVAIPACNLPAAGHDGGDTACHASAHAGPTTPLFGTLCLEFFGIYFFQLCPRANGIQQPSTCVHFA